MYNNAAANMCLVPRRVQAGRQSSADQPIGDHIMYTSHLRLLEGCDGPVGSYYVPWRLPMR